MTQHKPSIRLVYVAGAFRGRTFADVQQNIDRAAWMRAPIARHGCMPICVHIGEGLAMHDINQENNGEWWLRSTMAVLERCDSVVLVPDWEASEGTFFEVKRALELRMPVYLPTGRFAIDSPSRWLRVRALYGAFGNVTVDLDALDTFALYAYEQTQILENT